MNKLLTVVVPCKNEGMGVIDVINLLLERINCKVIIADCSDDEKSLFLLSKYASVHPNVSIVEGGLPSIARNRGAALVTTPYVLFLDADVYIFNPHLLWDCLSMIRGGGYDLVTCKFKTDQPYQWVFRIFNFIQLLSSYVSPFALGGFMMFNTETFRALGGFNQEDVVAEDYRLSSKIKPRKFKILNKEVYTPSRRFQNKGVWYMVKLMWLCWLNRNNDKFFKKDHSYWV